MNVLMAISFLFFPFAIAQTGNDTHAILRGVVSLQSTNGTLRTVPGAIVRAYSDADVQETRAGADGRYEFLSLIPGDYRVFAASDGPLAGLMCWADPDTTELSAGLEYRANLVIYSSCM
jgi:hypothetical protein